MLLSSWYRRPSEPVYVGDFVTHHLTRRPISLAFLFTFDHDYVRFIPPQNHALTQKPLDSQAIFTWHPLSHFSYLGQELKSVFLRYIQSSTSGSSHDSSSSSSALQEIKQNFWTTLPARARRELIMSVGVA